MSEETSSVVTQALQKERGPRQVRVGTVTSNKMDKTVVVSVNRPVMHRLYHRSLRRSTRLVVHDESNDCREGDLVSVESTRPLSKRKRWRVKKILKRAQG